MRLNIPDVQRLAMYIGVGAAVAKLHGRSEGEADYLEHVTDPMLKWLVSQQYLHEAGFKKIVERSKNDTLANWREAEVEAWLKEHAKAAGLS